MIRGIVILLYNVICVSIDFRSRNMRVFRFLDLSDAN